MDDRPPVTLFAALRHHVLLILAVIAAALMVAAVLSLRATTYYASTVVYLDTSRTAANFDAGVTSGELLQHDLVILATSRSVLQAACTAPGVECRADELASPESTLAKRISVNVYRGTSMLTVGARAPTAAAAAALANAVAAGMIAADRAEVARLYKPGFDDLDRQLKDLTAAIDKQQQAVQGAKAGSSAATTGQMALAQLQSQYAALFAQRQTISQQQDRMMNVATVVQPAVAPAHPVAPDPPRNLLAGLAAGLGLGVLLALLAERLSDRIVDEAGLAYATGVPVAVAASTVRHRWPSPEHRPYSLALASVLARAPETRALMVTSASADDHSQAVAAGLGAAAALAGQRVVVVQADGQAAHDGNGHTPNGGWFPHQQVTGMTTVTPPEDGGGTATAVTQLLKQYDFESADTLLVVAVPSPDTNPIALLLGQTARRAVLAATAGVTRFRDARRTAELLRHAGVEIAAAILLQPDANGTK
jgi:capsular polysaccharide biosynthesis protein